MPQGPFLHLCYDHGPLPRTGCPGQTVRSLLGLCAGLDSVTTTPRPGTLFARTACPHFGL